MKRNRTKTFYCRKSNDFKLGLEKSNALSYDYKVNHPIYSHKVYKDFHKVLITVVDINPLGIYFDGEEHSIESEKEKQKRKSFYTVKQNVHDLYANGKKRKAIFTKQGSFENARTVADLTISYKQIYDINRSTKEDNLSKF